MGRPRRASIAQRLLARTRRLQDSGGARLAASVVARRQSTANALVPRLLPQRETRGRASVSLARQSDPPAAGTNEPAVAVPEGMSEFAAEWLFGEGDVKGIPFAGGAALPVSERPAFLPAASAPAPATARAPRAGVRPRGRVQEGPVRLSAVPPAPAAPAFDPGSSGAAKAASDPVPPTDPASVVDPASAVPASATDPASAADPARSDRSPAIDPAPSSPPTAEDPAPATVFTPPLSAPAGSTGVIPGAPSSAPAGSSGSAPAIPPPAAKATPVVLAPKRRGEPASTPPPRPPVALRRVARLSAPAQGPGTATAPASPPRGLLRRALDRVLPGRRAEQNGTSPAGASRVGASVATPSAGGGSGAARIGMLSGLPAGARAARTPAARPDAPASRQGAPPPVGPVASADRRVAPLLREPLRSPDTTPAALAAPSSGARVDRAPAEGAAASPAPSPEIPVAPLDMSSVEGAPAPSRPAPTLARVARPAGGMSSSTPAGDPAGGLPARSRDVRGVSSSPRSREPSRPSAPAAAVRASAPSVPTAGRDAPATGASEAGGLRRVLARLRANRTPQLPPWESFASELAADSGSIVASAGEPTDAPVTIHDAASGPWLASSPATGGLTPQLPLAPGVTRGLEIPPPTPAPGIARAASGAPVGPLVRPPVRLRRVPARIFAPQLAPTVSARADLRSVMPRSRPGAPTSGERLAGATGATLHREVAGGQETIEFFPGDSDVPASVIARAPSGAPAAAEAPAAETPAPSGAPAAGGAVAAGGASASHAGASPEADDMYEHIIERLRRDLLTERERMGDLLGDLP
jgi:hypothetical protein